MSIKITIIYGIYRFWQYIIQDSLGSCLFGSLIHTGLLITCTLPANLLLKMTQSCFSALVSTIFFSLSSQLSHSLGRVSLKSSCRGEDRVSGTHQQPFGSSAPLGFTARNRFCNSYSLSLKLHMSVFSHSERQQYALTSNSSLRPRYSQRQLNHSNCKSIIHSYIKSTTFCQSLHGYGYF